ncbi:probable protein phosphatase 2C 34 [Pyrus x bretschneideri]|uniref:probable protein phosphatase 2C 34 n=1 Tax=Pyrus x bretschneideri TaxID=225117 RepID=UPI0005107C2A|nr:probable protein phosphatase 2C 34 [Pyrus x bretschneideri]
MVLFPSLLEGWGRTKSGKKTKNCPSDVARKTAKAWEKEAKKNERVSSSSGVVMSERSNTLSSVCSKRGRKGINQDCLTIWKEFGCQEDMIFCGIFDGHGQWGHLVSKRVRESLPASLLCNWQETLTSTSLDPDFEMEMDRNLHGFDMWKQSFLKTYAAIDKELKHSSKLNSYWSGATALTIIKQGENLVVANIGDSRAVLASVSDDGSLAALQLTVDFKPNLPQEAERINRSNGRVFCLQDEPGTYRVWMPNGKTPGLAISRAFGDYCVKDFGLISMPDVTQRRITSSDQFVILATDGVWDVISNQEAVKIVSSCPDRKKTAKRLVGCAALAWKTKKRGIAMDDISAICLFFHASSPPQANHLVSKYSGVKESG